MTGPGFYFRDQSGQLLFEPERVTFPDGTALDAADQVHRTVAHNGWRWFDTEAQALEGDYSSSPNVDARYGLLYDLLIASTVYQGYVGAAMQPNAITPQATAMSALGLALLKAQLGPPNIPAITSALGLVLAVGQFSTEEIAELSELLAVVGLADTYPLG